MKETNIQLLELFEDCDAIGKLIHELNIKIDECANFDNRTLIIILERLLIESLKELKQIIEKLDSYTAFFMKHKDNVIYRDTYIFFVKNIRALQNLYSNLLEIISQPILVYTALGNEIKEIIHQIHHIENKIYKNPEVDDLIYKLKRTMEAEKNKGLNQNEILDMFFDFFFPFFLECYEKIYDLTISMDEIPYEQFLMHNNKPHIAKVYELFEETEKLLGIMRYYFPWYENFISQESTLSEEEQENLNIFTNRNLMAINFFSNIKSFLTIYQTSSETSIQDLALKSIYSCSGIVSSLSDDIIFILKEAQKARLK